MKRLKNKLVELAQKKLAWGIAVMVANQVQGFLPTLNEYIPLKILGLLAFGISVILTVMKGVEMFYEKTEQLVKTGEISFDTEEIVNPNPPKQP